MHPFIFTIPTPWGEVPVFSYGVMLGISLLVAWYFLMHYGYKIEGFDRDLMANCFIVTAVCSIIGARLLYIITQPHEFTTLGSLFKLRGGGLVAYGGFIGGAFTAWAFMRWKKVPFLPFADIVAPTLATGLMITRVGCYLYGCDFGKRLSADAPDFLKRLGTFPEWDFSDHEFISVLGDMQMYGSPAWRRHVTSDTAEIAAQAAELHHSLPVHPTQLYASLAGLVIFGVSFTMLKKRTFKGQVWWTTVGLYAVWRFIVEFWRDDPERGFAMGYSTSQIVSALVLPLAAYALYHTYKRAQEHGDYVVPDSARDAEWLAARAADGGATGEAAEKPAAQPAHQTKRKKKKKKR